jgi:predicted Zn-dependent peptidase
MHADTGDVGVYMGTDASKIDRATKLIFRELDKLVQKRVSDRSLSQAKSQVKGGIMLGLESMSNRMMRLGRQELYYNAHHSLDHVIGQVESVTVDQLREVAEELFDPQQFTRVVLLPGS